MAPTTKATNTTKLAGQLSKLHYTAPMLNCNSKPVTIIPILMAKPSFMLHGLFHIKAYSIDFFDKYPKSYSHTQICSSEIPIFGYVVNICSSTFKRRSILFFISSSSFFQKFALCFGITEPLRHHFVQETILLVLQLRHIKTYILLRLRLG